MRGVNGKRRANCPPPIRNRIPTPLKGQAQLVLTRPIRKPLRRTPKRRNMKKLLLLFTLVALLCLSACSLGIKESATDISNTDVPAVPSQDWMHTESSKEYVTEFMAACGSIQGENLLFGYEFSEDYCFNVTPSIVSAATDVKIFKFSNSCTSLAWIDGEVYEICPSFGGFGFFNAMPWDYDKDGTTDLLVASSWGSGIHRSEISVFNVKTKESTVLCSSLDMKDSQFSNDWFVAAQAPSSENRNQETLSDEFLVCSANIEHGENLIDINYTAESCVGSIKLENGNPTFIPAEWTQNNNRK